MKHLFSLLVCAIAAIPCMAQGWVKHQEYLNEANEIKAGSPVDVTKKTSTVNLKYTSAYYPFYVRDIVTGLEFRGYNPGKELTRHYTVKVCLDFFDNNYSTVFDGDCTIPSGGTADDCITLLSFDFSQQLTIGDGATNVWIKISSEGDVADEPIYFEHRVTDWVDQPSALLSWESESAYYSGKVQNQNEEPVANATFCLWNGNLQYEGQSDKRGNCKVLVEESTRTYGMSVSAEGYPTYETRPFCISEYYYSSSLTPNDVPTRITMYNRVDFYQDQQATIILPTDPDPSWGRYYRMEGRDGDAVVFARESSPKANVPYVIFPAEDFSLNTADYYMEEMPTPEHVEYEDGNEWTTTIFRGSYTSKPAFQHLIDGQDVYFLDTTPDCVHEPIERFRDRIGAYRALLVLEYSYKGGHEYIFRENSVNGITDVTANSTSTKHYYDLQGRKLESKPQSGIYIVGGKKYVVARQE